MKHTKKSFVSAFLAIIMMITCLLSFGCIGADAISLNNTSDIQSVHYFYDYFPTARESTIASEFPGCDIVYHRGDLSTNGLDNLVDNGYFSVSRRTCFILDIKRSTPDGDLLTTLFSNLKALGHMIVLVTSFDVSQFGSTGFINYVDEMSLANFNRLISYAYSAVDYFFTANSTLENSCFMFESYHLGASGINTYWGYGMNQLCQESHFLRYLLDELGSLLLIEDEGYSDYDYEDIVQQLHTRFNIDFYAHVGGSTYVDIRTWQSCTLLDADDFLEENECLYDRICAMGFTHFNSSFYNFLYDSQSNCITDVLVFAMLVEPVTYSEDGLYGVIYSGGSFEDATNDDPEWILVSKLHSLLG